ncbi:MAG: hypothetical protein J6W35_07020 [Eubacterium sp.]|nr:hypothetical protein [Eubacterium sp.]
MKTMDTVISKLNNGDLFFVGGREYVFIGKTVFKGIESYVSCNQVNGDFVGFSPNQSVEIPRPKPVRTDFWYKKKFLTLVCRHIEPDRIEVRFSDLCSRLFRIINNGEAGMIDELGGRYSRNDYVISVDYRHWTGITIMLINTITGKSVAVKHINTEKVTTDNVHLILFELYKKYMNQ